MGSQGSRTAAWNCFPGSLNMHPTVFKRLAHWWAKRTAHQRCACGHLEALYWWWCVPSAASHGECECGSRGPADASSTDLLMCCVLFNYNCFICRGLSYITIHRESIHGNSLCKSSCFQFNTTRGLTTPSDWSKCIVSFFWGFLQCFANGLVCIYIKNEGPNVAKLMYAWSVSSYTFKK